MSTCFMQQFHIDKPVASQLNEKFSTFYGVQSFITMYKRAHQVRDCVVFCDLSDMQFIFLKSHKKAMWNSYR